MAQSSPGFATPGSGPTQYRIDPGLQDLPSIPFLYFLESTSQDTPAPHRSQDCPSDGIGRCPGPYTLTWSLSILDAFPTSVT